MWIINYNGPDEDDTAPDIDAGAEVPADFMDDAERDAAAAAEEAAKGGDVEPEIKPKTDEEILDEVQEAMGVPEKDREKLKSAKPSPASKDKPAEAVKPPVQSEAPAPKPGDKPAAKPAEAAPAADPAKAEAERVAAVDKEADALGLKSKTARERFHELNRTVAAQGEQISVLEKLAPPADENDKRTPVERISAVIKDQSEFQDAIFSTGLSADDFKTAAGYKMSVSSNDPISWQRARDWLAGEIDILDKKLGVKTEDGKEPLEQFEDLKTELAAGGNRALLNEIAQQRVLRTRGEQARTQTTEQLQVRQAQETAVEACATFAQQLAKDDPAQWAAKAQALMPKLREIQAKHPPSEWRDRMELEFHRIPYKPAAVTVTPPTQPVVERRPGRLPNGGGGMRRPGGASPGGMHVDKTQQTDMQALAEGLGLDAADIG